MNLTEQQIMAMFRQARRPAQPKFPQLIPVNLDRCPQLEKDYEKIDSPEIKALFKALFTWQETKAVNLKDLLPFKEHKTAMPVCNKVFDGRELVYRCYDCLHHEAAVFCQRCFEEGDHRGHRFTKIQSGGGNCDCGNPDALKQKGFCRHHTGKAEQMMIDEKDQVQFRLYWRQLMIWVLRLYDIGLKLESQTLLLHMIAVLEWLNEESLFYNTLTNRLLFDHDNIMVQHIFVIGGKQSKTKLVDKHATELFLKMFSLEIFKRNISVAFLKAYNSLPQFENTKFESLFIQLFANVDLVLDITGTEKISLSPKDREFNPMSYYNSMAFMGTIRQDAACSFFRPIINNGGVPLNLLKNIEEDCEQGSQAIYQIYRETLNTENMYYQVQKVVLKVTQTQPDLLDQQICNLHAQIKAYSFNNNKVVIPFHRMFILYCFARQECRLHKASVESIRQLLGIDRKQMVKFIRQILSCFIHCLKQLACAIADPSGQYPFENYLNLYTNSVGSSLPIIYDMLGVKMCALWLEQLQQTDLLQDMVLQFVHDYIKKVNQQEYTQKQKRRHFDKIVNYLGLILEAAVQSRSEVMISCDLQVMNDDIMKVYDGQIRALLLNKKQVNAQQLDLIGQFFFSTSINRPVLSNKYATFDKVKKVYRVEPNVQGTAFNKRYMKSLSKVPFESVLKSSDTIQLVPTDSMAHLAHLLLTSSRLKGIFEHLIRIAQQVEEEDVFKSKKELVFLLKALSLVFEETNEIVEDAIASVIAITPTQEEQVQLKNIIGANLQVETTTGANSEQIKKRKELLKLKKQEKLNKLKIKDNTQKFLKSQMVEESEQSSQTCLLCRQGSSKAPLCYMGSLFMSNLVQSQLKVEGKHPFMKSCFHPVHFNCFLGVTKGRPRTQCPLCKTLSNIVVPNENALQDEELLKSIMTRIETVMAMQNSQISEYPEIEQLKSIMQLIASCMIDPQPPSRNQLRLHRLMVSIAKHKFRTIQAQQGKDEFIDRLVKSSQPYHLDSKDDFNIGLLIHLPLSLIAEQLKGNKVTLDIIKQIVGPKPLLGKQDLMVALRVTQNVLEIEGEDWTGGWEQWDSGLPSLGSKIVFFQPPKSVSELLSVNLGDSACKMGHHVCECVICGWRGCFTCKQTDSHAQKCHNNETILFDYVIGGLHCYLIGTNLRTRSLYLNEIGDHWLPKYESEGYLLDRNMYQQLITSLKTASLLEAVSKNYAELRWEE